MELQVQVPAPTKAQIQIQVQVWWLVWMLEEQEEAPGLGGTELGEPAAVLRSEEQVACAQPHMPLGERARL